MTIHRIGDAQPHRGLLLLLSLAAFSLGIGAGCREIDPIERNRAPETYLVESPSYGQSGFYINHLFWDGFDPDGSVAYFEVAVTDSFGDLETAIWKATTRNDSLIQFPVGGEQGLNQILGNRFYVRAVDQLGRPDPLPAWIFFAARDAVYPEIHFTTAEGSHPTWPSETNPTTVRLTPVETCDSGFPPDTLPAGATVEFEWYATDLDSLLGVQVGSIVSYDYRLLTVDNTVLGGTLASTSVTYEDMPPGTHSFVVRAKDDGGLIGEGCRYFQVNFDPRAVIHQVRNSCTGENVPAVRLATRYNRTGNDPCADEFTFNTWDPVALGLPTLDANSCLPPGFIAVSDTLPAPSVDEGWWFEANVSSRDTDGLVADLESSYGFCSRSSAGTLICQARPWNCAARSATGSDTTLVIGPIMPGDTRFVIAAVDDLGQRGTTNADTLDFFVDFKPQLVHRIDGLDNQPCNRLFGNLGELVSVCDTDSVLRVANVQSSGDLGAPCALATTYDADGRAAPYSALDYQSLPLPGRTYAVEFEPELQNDGSTLWVAPFPVQLWMRDPDGNGRVSSIRWAIDRPLRSTTPFERVTRLDSEAAAEELTPACFEVRLVHDGSGRVGVRHDLVVDIRDRSRFDSSFGANRTSRHTISFFVTDATE